MPKNLAHFSVCHEIAEKVLVFIVLIEQLLDKDLNEAF